MMRLNFRTGPLNMDIISQLEYRKRIATLNISTGIHKTGGKVDPVAYHLPHSQTYFCNRKAQHEHQLEQFTYDTAIGLHIYTSE